MQDNFSCFCCHLTFFKINFFIKLFQEHYQSHSLDPDQDRHSVSLDLDPNLLAEVISRGQKLPLARKESNHSLTEVTIKHVLSGRSKLDKSKGLKTGGSLVQVNSIVECSSGAFCNSFDLY